MGNSKPSLPVVQILRRAGEREWALKLETCGTPVRITQCAQCGWESHPQKFHCKLRLCQDCMATRSNIIRDKYKDAVKEMGHPAFWTLTLVDSNDLEGDLVRIRAAFNKLRHRKPYKHILKGGIYCLEVGPGKTRKYRVHLHALVDSFFISQKKLSDDWKDLTKDSYIVDVRRVRGRRDAALSYLLKYITKLWKMDEGLLLFMTNVCKVMSNTRLVQTVGSLYGKAKTVATGSGGCPTCHADLWLVLDYITREILFDSVELLRRQAARAGPR